MTRWLRYGPPRKHVVRFCHRMSHWSDMPSRLEGFAERQAAREAKRAQRYRRWKLSESYPPIDKRWPKILTSDIMKFPDCAKSGKM